MRAALKFLANTSNSDPGNVLLTPKQLAIRIGFSVRKVRQYARAGKLPAVRLNRRDIRFHWPTVIQRLTGA